ncbi:Glu/Leu/Phe/Val dehydrogenase, partial [Candidatus Uhrbacteria bacterium]|nr:Glu/Leu/Phe/Val dehydrogenase [Candidatus Uhrbacteria bacterium]MBD3283819.1 Glu/Leu/Phe/Val dehydrogenase [Candidatus Uhrbacteria bacterium]
ALEGVINKATVDRLCAKIVLEVANGPTTPEADAVLEKSGTIVIPDVLVNAGGVVVSYFEWLQNREGKIWTEGEVEEKLYQTMKSAAEDLSAYAKSHGCSLRVAAYALAMERIVAAEHDRGHF